MSTKKKEPTPPENKAPDTDRDNPKKETADNSAETAGDKEIKPDQTVNEAQKPDEQTAEEKKPEEKKTAAPSPEDQVKAERDKYLRLMAEYDNYRKRSVKERESIYSDVRSDTITKFLPVYDNLVRALAQSTEDEAYRRGVEMIMNQFCEVMKKFGVTEIESVGKTFDPSLHNAVMHEVDETKGEGEIVMELQKGFMLGGKVIRFAMVKVAN